MKNLGGECVFAAEIDDHVRKTYEKNLIKDDSFLKNDDYFVKDITKVSVESIPSFDVLCAGFPCQPFSQAGLKKGFSEACGTLFFSIASIIEEKQPKALFRKCETPASAMMGVKLLRR